MEDHSFSILNFFLNSIKNSNPSKQYKIGIGLSENIQRNQEIIAAYNSILNDHQDIPVFKTIKIVFYAPKQQNKDIDTNSIGKISDFMLIESEKPEEKIIGDLIQNTIHAVIRGSISANKMLATIKSSLYNSSNIAMNRLALLETASGRQFFFAPVGIDEAENVDTKVEFIKFCDQLFNKLHLKIHINILGEGRIGDKGRSKIIDQKLDESMKFLEKLKNLEKDDDFHTSYEYKEILIENAIENDKKCMIFAPDGISGNLIYRTLIHLGGGRSFGAIYLREYLEKNFVIIDTSRVAPDFELKGALIVALGLLILNQ